MNVTPLFKNPPDVTEQAEQCVRKLGALAVHLAFLMQDVEPGSEAAEAVVDDLEVAVEDLTNVLRRLQ